MCPKCGRIYNLKYNPPKEDELCDCCKVKLVQREDDKEDVVRYRLKRFYDEIEGIRKHFESAGRLVKIDANRSIEEIVRDVEKCLS
jgi:adenylate kinase